MLVERFRYGPLYHLSQTRLISLRLILWGKQVSLSSINADEFIRRYESETLLLSIILKLLEELTDLLSERIILKKKYGISLSTVSSSQTADI